MTTRKRPRPSAQQPEAQPLRRNGEATASNTDPEGVGSSPRAFRSARKQAPKGNSEEQSQQAFDTLQLTEQLAVPELVRLADDHSVVWCRVKGFPAWPVGFPHSFTCMSDNMGGQHIALYV